MASLEISKRPRDDSPEPRKRQRRLGQVASPALIDLRAPSHQELLTRLARLFPSKSPLELETAIALSHENLGVCMLLLQKQTFDDTIRSKIDEYAKSLVQSLLEAPNMDAARSVIRHYFESFFVGIQESVNKMLVQENQQLTGQVELLGKDTSLLKKAVLKLFHRGCREEELERKLAAVNEQLKNEQMRTFSLKAQICSVTGELGYEI